ncbi:MAG: acyltransferase family protein [Clostridium sp.]|nr:acyltransferase family protein [Clostridium sp.]
MTRISKVAIPYVIWTVIYSLLFWGGFKKFLINLLSANAGIQFYYIFVYIQLVLLTPLVIKLLKSKYNWIGFIITPLFIIIARYIFPFAGFEIVEPFKKTIFLNWFTYYYLGMAIKNKVINYRISGKKTMLLYIITLLCCSAEGFAWYYLDNNFDMATTIMKLSSVALCIAIEFLAYIFITSDKITINDTNDTRVLFFNGFPT